MTKRRIFILLSLAVAVGLTTSCILDPKESGKGEETQDQPDYKDLSVKDHVLHNLELAYNERNIDEYRRLLDDNFTFIFSEADYNDGVVDFPQWDRNTEEVTTATMLDPGSNRPDRVISVDLDINYAVENWSEQPPNVSHPDESWYTQTVDYDLTIKTADEWEYRANGLQAQFTIRWAQTEDGEFYRIVLWRDDVGAQ